MKFQGALIKEQGVDFAIVIVKSDVLNNHSGANQLIRNFQQGIFGNIPIILMAQNSAGVPTYYGRQDIAKFLSKVPIEAIPWKEYQLS